MGRRMVAMVPEQIGPPGNGPCSEPSDIGSSSGSFIRFLRDGPIPIPYSNWTDIEPIVNRYGKQSAPECRRAFLLSYSGTDTSDKEQSRADTINTSREKQNEKKPRREQTEKEATHNQRTSQKNKQRQLNSKTDRPTAQTREKPKTIHTKKKPRASCTRLRG